VSSHATSSTVELTEAARPIYCTVVRVHAKTAMDSLITSVCGTDQIARRVLGFDKFTTLQIKVQLDIHQGDRYRIEGLSS
jgi:hypothetical protein